MTETNPKPVRPPRNAPPEAKKAYKSAYHRWWQKNKRAKPETKSDTPPTPPASSSPVDLISTLTATPPATSGDYRTLFILRGLIAAAVGCQRFEQKLAAVITPLEPHVTRKRMYACAVLWALMDTLPSVPRLSAYRDQFRPTIERNRDALRALMTARARQILEGLPSWVRLYRAGSEPCSRGWVWCSTREAAEVYPAMPWSLDPRAVLTVATVERERIAYLWETPGGWECVAFLHETDNVTISQLHHANTH